MITKHRPASWRDLQEKVGDILRNCGFDVVIEKKLSTARGNVEIDVFAEEEIDGRKYSIICECKYWGTAIPQNVIHGFRTVINDIGSNVGYIITTSNYQSGSKLAAEKTNIELLTWEEFQALFFESWYSKYFCNRIQDELKITSDYSWVDWFDDLTPEDKRIYSELKNKLTELSEVQSNFPRPFLKTINPAYFYIPTLPLLGNVIESTDYFGDLSNEILTETGYLEFLEKFISYGKEIIAQFMTLNAKYTLE